MSKNILFLTLKVFSATGGIEKVCRVAGKSLYEFARQHDKSAQVYCMHDAREAAEDNRYFPAEMFRGFGGKRWAFIRQAVKAGKRSGTVLISHINLLPVAWLIKKRSPSTRIVMFAHGIEIWGELPAHKKAMLSCCDRILSVSHFTSDKIRDKHKLPASVLTVLNNCLDPYMPVGYAKDPHGSLRKKYGFRQQDIVLFTLTRLSSAERYKGYDKVLASLAELRTLFPQIRYLLAGSYDVEEKRYLDEIITRLDLADIVSMPGFIPDDQLVDHFTSSDVYIMPSMNEGFGIVFIEAMYYGLPVIAGNRDGSADALLQGELGQLVDPADTVAITQAIASVLQDRARFLPDKKKLLAHFGYDRYKQSFEELTGIAS